VRTSRRATHVLGALCGLLLLGLWTTSSAFASSIVNGEVIIDDRFGDYAVIDVRGNPGGSVLTVQKVGDRIWRVHDRAGVDGGGFCSDNIAPRTVLCEPPMSPDLVMSMGKRRDTVTVIGGGLLYLTVSLGGGEDQTDLRELKHGLYGDPSAFIWGGAGEDRLVGSDGDDYLNGRLGKDVIRGRDGADEIHGNEGKDRLYGARGADNLDSGLDEVPDELSCGRGRDRARYGPKDLFLSSDCEIRTRDAGSLIPDRMR
jgi:Ca2+-binding RTX toxin-like protein